MRSALRTVVRVAKAFGILIAVSWGFLFYTIKQMEHRTESLRDAVKVDESLARIVTNPAFLEAALPTFGSSISAKKPGRSGSSEHCLWILRNSKETFHVKGKDTEGSVLPLTDLSGYLANHISDLEACDQMDFTVQANGWVWRGAVTVDYDRSLTVRSVQQPVYWD